MLTLRDIKGDVGIKEKIRWDFILEKVFVGGSIPFQEDLERIAKEQEEKAGYYFFVNVSDCYVYLFLMKNGADRSEVIGEIKEIPQSYLVDAISQAGMGITTDGHYPINEKIEAWLKNELSK